MSQRVYGFSLIMRVFRLRNFSSLVKVFSQMVGSRRKREKLPDLVIHPEDFPVVLIHILFNNQVQRCFGTRLNYLDDVAAHTISAIFPMSIVVPLTTTFFFARASRNFLVYSMLFVFYLLLNRSVCDHCMRSARRKTIK